MSGSQGVPSKRPGRPGAPPTSEVSGKGGLWELLWISSIPPGQLTGLLPSLPSPSLWAQVLGAVSESMETTEEAEIRREEGAENRFANPGEGEGSTPSLMSKSQRYHFSLPGSHPTGEGLAPISHQDVERRAGEGLLLWGGASRPRRGGRQGSGEGRRAWGAGCGGCADRGSGVRALGLEVGKWVSVVGRGRVGR